LEGVRIEVQGILWIVLKVGIVEGSEERRQKVESI